MISGGLQEGGGEGEITVPSFRQSTFRLYFQFLDEMKCNRTPQNLLPPYNFITQHINVGGGQVEEKVQL